MRPHHLLLGAIATAVLVVHCGRKTSPKPPELIRPEALRAVEVRNLDDGIEVSWKRPREYVDGSRMYDLAGFRVERGDEHGTWSLLVELTVDDRDRFRQLKNFKHIDETVSTGELWRYRVQSFTLDRDLSEFTESTFIVREVPPPPTATP